MNKSNLKLCIKIFLFVFLVNFFTINEANASSKDTIIKVLPSVLNLVSGDPFTATIQIDNSQSNQEIITAGFDLSFPPNLLQVIDSDQATAGVQIDISSNDFNVNEPEFNLVNNTTGTINFTAGTQGTNPLTQDTITLAKIQFQTKANLQTQSVANINILNTMNTGVYVTNYLGYPENIMDLGQGIKNSIVTIQNKSTSGGGSSGGGGGGGGSSGRRDDKNIYYSTEQDEKDINEDSQAEHTIVFSDVNENNPFISYINKLSSLKVISGYNDNSFKPNNSITRAEFLKILIGSLGVQPETPAEEQEFIDVSSDNVFYPWIMYSFKNNFITGYKDDTFRPNDNISRYEAVVIILRAKKATIKNVEKSSRYFIDVDVQDIAKYTDTAFEMNILSGFNDNTFRPHNDITRGETSKVIVKTFID